MSIRVAGRGLLAAAALAGLAGMGAAAPATASSVAGTLTAPGIHSVSPARGAAGTKVTITGTGFTRVSAVRFRGVAAAFTVRSRFRVTAVVPAMPSGAGRITVITRAGTARSRARFTVTARITLSPVTGPPGSVVTVSGTGFGATEGVDVFIGTADKALAGTGPAGSFGPIRVTIGARTVPGTAWFSAEGRHSRLFAQAAFTVNTNWAQFRFSALHTGTNPHETVLSTANVARLTLHWSFRTRNLVQSSPAVANAVVYIGSDDGNLYALDAATGIRKWSFPTRGHVFTSSPAVVNGVVYIGTLINLPGGRTSGRLYALNAATGARKWSFTTGTGAESPAVANGTVYTTSLGGHVYALNAATGTRKWTFTASDPVSSSPAVANGTVYFGSLGGHVYALNAATGRTRWTFTTRSGLGQFFSPAVTHGVVYISSLDSGLYAFNAATGSELWNLPSYGSIESSPAVANGVLYIGAANDVAALNATTGASLWNFSNGDDIVGSSPAVANGVLYIGTNDHHHLDALNAATGALLWTFTTNRGIYSSPAVANGMVYIGELNHNVDAFGLTRGHATPARPDQNSLHPDYNLPRASGIAASLSHQCAESRAVRQGHGAQPDGPDGQARGGCPGGSVPGQPSRQLHHRH